MSFGFNLRASGDLLDAYSAGGAAGGSALVPGGAAAHQFGAGLWFVPSEGQAIWLFGFYDEQTGVDCPGRRLTTEHSQLRAWRASYRIARFECLLSGPNFSRSLNKQGLRTSNRGKPTAMDMPGRMPPFVLDISLPAESDTLGGSGRLEIFPRENWPV